MSTELNKMPFKSLLNTDIIKAKFNEVLKDKASGFTSNLAVMVNSSEALIKCEPLSIISAAIISASLELPLDKNLGFAAIVPFNEKQKDGKYLSKAQFQIMYKGLIQLAIRSGQYERIGVTPIFDGQLKNENPLTGDYEFDFKQKSSSKIIGYAAYFRLLNGFQKTEYWDIEKIQAHGKKFSQTYKKNYGLWVDDFDSMASKTVLKSLISKWGILSIQMQQAVKYDQSVIREDLQPDYVDSDFQEVNEPDFDENHPEYKNAVLALKSGDINIEQLSIKFNLSDEIKLKIQADAR